MRAWERQATRSDEEANLREEQDNQQPQNKGRALDFLNMLISSITQVSRYFVFSTGSRRRKSLFVPPISTGTVKE